MFDKFISCFLIKFLKRIKICNSRHFLVAFLSKCGGYTFAHTYIEYLDKTYGWDKVLRLVETESYEECFDKSKKEIYMEWVHYIENYFQ